MKLVPASVIHKASIILCTSASLMSGAVNGQGRSDTLHDRDGNIYTLRLMPDNKVWMTDNLNINLPGSYCYADSAGYCKQYGRLYTWKQATQACELLGQSWRLPTNEDWQRMASHFGGVRGDSKDSGSMAYKALINGGSSGFNAEYGGGRDANGTYARLEAHGLYWAATENDSATAWFYNFGKGGKILNRHRDGEKDGAMSVRCIRDAGRAK